MGWWVGVAVVAGLVAMSAPADAQTAGNKNPSVLGTFGAGDDDRGAKRGPRVPPPQLSAGPRRLEVWPRLDAGSVLCKARSDLAVRARLLADADGAVPELPPGCRMIRQQVGVTVVQRIPPAATEVKLRDTGEGGWTDIYLPERPPGL